MNYTPQADLDALYSLLPIMWGEQPAACRKLGISRLTLWRRLKLLEVRGLVVSIGTGWVSTADSWIEERIAEAISLATRLAQAMGVPEAEIQEALDD